MAIMTCLSTITLKINGLNTPIKRHGVDKWITKQDPYMCCLQEAHVRQQDTHKVKGQKKILYGNES